jgi:hypothetical protein
VLIIVTNQHKVKLEEQMKSFIKSSAVMLFLAALLAACGGNATPDTNAVDIILTEGVQTMVAAHFATQTALVTPATATRAVTSTPPSYTPLAAASMAATPTPTWPFTTATLGTPLTPSVTGTVFTPTSDPSSLAYGCNNLAFVRDVTVPSGTVFKPGEDFKKTWKVANTGTCNWMYQYALVHVSGPTFNAETTKLGRVVTVGDWSELSLGMGAPGSPGTYTSYWRLMDADGHMFGATLVVSIKVSNPTPPTQPPSSTPVPSNTPVPTDTPEPTATTE